MIAHSLLISTKFESSKAKLDVAVESNSKPKQIFLNKCTMNTRHGSTLLWLQESQMEQFAFSSTPMT